MGCCCFAEFFVGIITGGAEEEGAGAGIVERGEDIERGGAYTAGLGAGHGFGEEGEPRIEEILGGEIREGGDESFAGARVALIIKEARGGGDGFRGADAYDCGGGGGAFARVGGAEVFALHFHDGSGPKIAAGCGRPAGCGRSGRGRGDARDAWWRAVGDLRGWGGVWGLGWRWRDYFWRGVFVEGEPCCDEDEQYAAKKYGAEELSSIF